MYLLSMFVGRCMWSIVNTSVFFTITYPSSQNIVLFSPRRMKKIYRIYSFSKWEDRLHLFLLFSNWTAQNLWTAECNVVICRNRYTSSVSPESVIFLFNDVSLHIRFPFPCFISTTIYQAVFLHGICVCSVHVLGSHLLNNKCAFCPETPNIL